MRPWDLKPPDILPQNQSMNPPIEPMPAKPSRAPLRLLVLGNANKPRVLEEADRLLPFLREHAEVVVFDLHQAQDLSSVHADIALVLGGDGAILRAARQMRYGQTPMLVVNLGKLGFLADLNPQDLCDCFPQVLQGAYRLTHPLSSACHSTSPNPPSH